MRIPVTDPTIESCLALLFSLLFLRNCKDMKSKRNYEGIKEYMLAYTWIVGLGKIPGLVAGGEGLWALGGTPEKRHET